MTTPNTQRGEMLVKVGDQEFTLVPTFARVDKLETLLGRPLIQLAAELAMVQRLSFRDVATIIHTMARDSKLSLNEVGDLIVQVGLSAAIPTLRKFFERVIGAGDEGKAKAGESGGPTSPGDAG